ncbi:hypothetical protein [Synechococcus sp. CC9311]|uniref:hypothetical protein n=1 Tax=Synechococcus sp. (strain CC9311) TaxID=64471 RepID=UPI0000DDAECC|nr:hypothetical protein [Synechococcus sp. CC9311]ABI47808.1 conserved hypothetical protein [Synechococcus sp. CC9311]
MASFLWKESNLTADCLTLEEMARRFEETALLMHRLHRCGFELNRIKGEQSISHKNIRTFSRFGFVIDKVLANIEQRSLKINQDKT